MPEPERQLPESYRAWRAWAESHAEGDGYYVQDGFEIGYEIGRADERSKVQDESALRAAARGAAEWISKYGHTVQAIAVASALWTALDGAPYEPSDAEVERAAEALRAAEEADCTEEGIGYREQARGALKAAWGRET